MKKITGLLAIALFCTAVHVPAVPAQEKGYELKSGAAVRDVLLENTGKRVIVRMDTGDAVEGTVNKVGEHLVHLSRISGRDFYDAAVRIERISAVIFKVRGN